MDSGLTFPRRGKVAREARRMGDVSTTSVFVFDIPHPPSRHLPPPGEGKTKSNGPYAIALPLARIASGTTLAGMTKALIDQLATPGFDEHLDSAIEERDAPALSDAQRRELRTRQEHHRAHPDEPTMTLAQIRTRLGID